MRFILLGFKKAGKTTLGKLAALHYGFPFIDTDTEIEKAYERYTGKALLCSQIFPEEGEKKFREIEREVITSLSYPSDSIISLGGGSLLEEKTAFFLKNQGKLIYLKVPKKELKKRCLSSPLFQLKGASAESLFEKLFPFRQNLYEKMADIQILLTGNLQENTKNFIDLLGKLLYGKQ